MLNKQELSSMRETMVTSGRHIVSLINSGHEDLAFMEFENGRRVYEVLGLGMEYKELIKDMLSRRVEGFNELFFTSFCASYIDYREGKISVARLKNFKKGGMTLDEVVGVMKKEKVYNVKYPRVWFKFINIDKIYGSNGWTCNEEEFKKVCIEKGLLDGWMIYEGEDE